MRIDKTVIELVFFLVLLTGLAIVVPIKGQSKSRTKSSHPASNTILFEVLKDMAENPCDDLMLRETMSGVVLKRDFAEDELRLSGFVLKLAGDKREYVNLDYEFISGRAASASSDLTDWLVVGRRLKVFGFRCRRIFTANRIQGL